MLSQQELRAFIPTVNPAAAKLFFQDTLGLTLMSEDSFAMEFNANGTVLRVATVGAYTPYPFTVLDWQVDDIKAEIAALKEKGVVFEIFGFFEQDTYGIWTAPGGTQVAWFKDPDGNTLSVSQQPV